MVDLSGLSKYFDQPTLAKPAVNTKNVANYILLNSNAAKSMGPGGIQQNNSPSIMSRIFDILSRPNYAIANTIKDMWHDPNADLAKSFISGLAGTQKTTFQDVLKEAGMPDSYGRAGLGLALDIGLDPTTYIPGGAIVKAVGKAGKLVGIGGKAAEAIDKSLPLAAKLAQGEQAVSDISKIPDALKSVTPPPADIRNAIPAENVIPKVENLIPQQLQLPFQVPDIAARLEGKQGAVKDLFGPEVLPTVEKTGQAAAKEVPGQIPLKFPGLSVRDTRAAVKAAQVASVDTAPKIVSKIAEGSTEDLAKTIPVPKPKITPEIQAVADNILKDFNPKKATAKINQQFPDTLNAKQQVYLWNKARAAVQGGVYRKGRDAAKVETEIMQKTLPVYHAIENSLRSAGYVPRIGTGDNVALSDLVPDMMLRGTSPTDQHLREFANSIKPGSPVHASIERLRARGVIQDAPIVHDVVDAVGQAKQATVITNSLSDAQHYNWDRFLKGFAKSTEKKLGVSPAAQRASDKMLQTTLQAGKSRAQIALDGMKHELDDVIARGKNSPKANRVTTLALEKNLGKLPKWAVNDNKAIEFMMGRFATWWGQSDLRPLSLHALASADATASARGKALASMFKGFDAGTRNQAFKVAQGTMHAATPEVQQLATSIDHTMSNLLGQASGSSVLLRSGVNMDLLNKWMKRYHTGFEFSKGTYKNPITGAIEDFSKGTDWVNSWKMHDIGKEDPAQWMFNTAQALEQATREKSLFDDMAERFGSTAYGKSYVNKIEGHPYLEGYYFPSDIAKQIPRVIKDWTLPVGSSNKMVQLYDRILSMWKSGVTIYRPGFYVRNIVGDVYLGALDGVVSVVPYKYAVQVQRALRTYDGTMQNVDKLVELGLVPRGLETPTPGKILFRNKSGVGFTAEQIGAVAHQKGLLESTASIDDLLDMGSPGGFSITRPLAGKGQALARTATEMQNHNARLAHFIDKVMKSRGSDLTAIFEDASRRARKFHPSGIDMTHFEKTVMRRIIPFYSWIRKSTPVLLEGLVMRPSVSVLPAKIAEALQMANGIDTNRADPFPTDQLFPAWIRNEGIGPISLPDGFLGSFSNQMPPGYVQAGVGLNPLSQLLSQFQDPGRTFGSSMTPVAQIPIELLTGKRIFTGAPITGPDAKPGAFQEYVGSQIPLFSAVQGISGFGLGGQTNKALTSDNQSGKEAFFNWLTGLGIKGTGPYIKQARYEKTQPIKQAQQANKAQFLSQLRAQYGG